MYNTALVHRMTFKGHSYVPSRHCPLALSEHILRSSKRQGAGVERNANNLANCYHLAQDLFSLTIAASTCPRKRIRSGQVQRYFSVVFSCLPQTVTQRLIGGTNLFKHPGQNFFLSTVHLFDYFCFNCVKTFGNVTMVSFLDYKYLHVLQTHL